MPVTKILMVEPGLDLHDWETRWQQLEDDFADLPEETLSEMGRLIEQMLVERGFQLDEPVTVEGEDPDIVRQFFAAREAARLAEGGEADAEDIAAAVEGYRDIHDYLVADRAPP